MTGTASYLTEDFLFSTGNKYGHITLYDTIPLLNHNFVYSGVYFGDHVNFVDAYIPDVLTPKANWLQVRGQKACL